MPTYVLTVPERHRETDGQTDGQTIYCGITALCMIETVPHNVLRNRITRKLNAATLSTRTHLVPTAKARTKYLESCSEVIQGHAFWDH